MTTQVLSENETVNPVTKGDKSAVNVGVADLLKDVWQLRRDLWARGYPPVAVYGPNSNVHSAGKRPKGNAWLERAREETPAAAGEQPDADALNTGILCDGLVAIDIDIDIDIPDFAAEVKAAVVTLLGKALLRARENSSRLLLLYRAADGEPATKKVNGKKGAVEILGRGHQFVAYGTHKTGVPLLWESAGPAEFDRDGLTSVTEPQVAALVHKLEELLDTPKIGAVSNVPATNLSSFLGQIADPLDIAAALFVIPNKGPKDWDHWNHVGMATFGASAGSTAGYAAWLSWSEKHPDHDPDRCLERWNNYEKSPPTHLGAGTLFHLASHARPGWKKLSVCSTPCPATLPPLKVVSAIKLMTMPLPPRGLVIDPWLPEKGLTMIYGPRGVGKTYLVHGVAHAIATGGLFLGWKAPKPRRVLIIDGEMPAVALKDRMLATMNGKKPELLDFIPLDMQERDLDLSETTHQAQLEPLLADTDVIIVDNISTLTRGGRENEAESWLPVQEWALQQRRVGRSVVFVHHAGKGGQQRGTSRREDVLDTVIALRRPADYRPEEGARFELHYEKARGFHGAEAAPFEAAFSKDDGWLIRDITDVKMARVVELTMAKSSVRDIAEELALSKSAVSRLQARARELGKLPPGGGAKKADT